MKRVIKRMVFLSMMLTGFLWACGEEPEVGPNPNQEIKDNSEISSVKINGGNKRIKLSWSLKTDPNATKVRIYWNNKADSVDVPVKNQTAVEDMEVVINNINEGPHTFRLHTTNGKNKPVLKMNVSGTVYGDNYIKSLVQRTLKSVTVTNGAALVDLGTVARESIGVEVKYTDKNGALQKDTIPTNAATHTLENYKAGSFFEYRTMFLPEPNLLDTFYTAFASSQNIPYFKSPITRQIANKSSLVKKVLYDTLIEIVPGLEQTKLWYEGNDGRLITMYVVTADLNNSNLKLKAITPYNKPDFARQVVSEMARYADAPGNRVLAAINGDFFSNVTPQGVVVKDGVAIKPEGREDASFVGVFKDGTLIIDTYERFKNVKHLMQEAVGAYHRLINNGAKVTQGDLSVEPRTIVGITNNKKVYFIVIDGRQSGYSQGMSFAQASDFLQALELKDAINLDGGGSSALVVKDDATNTWKVQNRPSDGTQRAVANGWSIVSVN